ncbi:MAG TPA: hypothetical protein VFU69_12665 [Ktedonobacterales bacterium]|nr:hypothetical protein [Ktedonobacterales bacterium]
MEARPTSVQAAALEQRMQQMDADWEALTRSIQADGQRLMGLQAHLDNLRLLLSLPLGGPPAKAPAMMAQIARLEQQIAWLRQCIAAQDVRRSAVERQFDQVRQVWAVLCYTAQKRRFRPERGYERAASWLRYALSRLWALLARSSGSDGVIPNDFSLRRHASTGGP